MSEVIDVPCDGSPAAPADGKPALDPAIVRYLDTLYDLKADAEKHGRLQKFADVLAFVLAHVAASSGGEAVGDVIQMFGRHVGASYASARAEAEAARARKAGRPPH